MHCYSFKIESAEIRKEDRVIIRITVNDKTNFYIDQDEIPQLKPMTNWIDSTDQGIVFNNFSFSKCKQQGKRAYCVHQNTTDIVLNREELESFIDILDRNRAAVSEVD